MQLKSPDQSKNGNINLVTEDKTAQDFLTRIYSGNCTMMLRAIEEKKRDVEETVQKESDPATKIMLKRMAEQIKAILDNAAIFIANESSKGENTDKNGNNTKNFTVQDIENNIREFLSKLTNEITKLPKIIQYNSAPEFFNSFLDIPKEIQDNTNDYRNFNKCKLEN